MTIVYTYNYHVHVHLHLAIQKNIQIYSIMDLTVTHLTKHVHLLLLRNLMNIDM